MNEKENLEQQLRNAQTRYIQAHSTIVNTFYPTPEQWIELETSAKEYQRIDKERRDKDEREI